MQLIQILLPLDDNEGRPFAANMFQSVKRELAEKFGGVTAFTQSPAEGLWEDGQEEASRDRIVVFEVMAQNIGEAWWRDYRRELERRFRQDEVVIRALPIRRL